MKALNRFNALERKARQQLRCPTCDGTGMALVSEEPTESSFLRLSFDEQRIVRALMKKTSDDIGKLNGSAIARAFELDALVSALRSWADKAEGEAAAARAEHERRTK